MPHQDLSAALGDDLSDTHFSNVAPAGIAPKSTDEILMIDLHNEQLNSALQDGVGLLIVSQDEEENDPNFTWSKGFQQLMCKIKLVKYVKIKLLKDS